MIRNRSPLEDVEPPMWNLIARELSAAMLWVASAFCVAWGLVDWSTGGWRLAIVGLYAAIIAATVSASVMIHRARLSRHATVDEIVRIASSLHHDGDEGGSNISRMR